MAHAGRLWRLYWLYMRGWDASVHVWLAHSGLHGVLCAVRACMEQFGMVEDWVSGNLRLLAAVHASVVLID